MEYKDHFYDVNAQGKEGDEPGVTQTGQEWTERGAVTEPPVTAGADYMASAEPPVTAGADHGAVTEPPVTAGADHMAVTEPPVAAGADYTALREPGRPRVYGKLNSQDATYYNAPNPYYRDGYRAESAPPRPEPRPLGAAPAGGGYYGGHSSGENPRDGIPSQGRDARTYARYAAPQAAAGQVAAARPALVDRRRFVILVCIIIAAMIASGIMGGVIGSNMNRNSAPIGVASTENAPSGENINITPSADINTTEAVAQKVLDSVVGITSTVTRDGGSYFGIELGSQESGGVGTGIIVDASGYILTNSHVVLDGELDKIEVLLSDGSTAPGQLLWNDSSIDLAIVRVDATGKTLKPAELGDSDKVKIGSYVAAIGNPLGLDFNGSITQGVVSGLGRSISASNGSSVTKMEDLIQVDAAINSGNSGGPLLNQKGQVIGVNTAKAQAEGMGFAIPINIAKPIVEKVIKTGGFERVYMGVSAADANVIAEQYPNLGLKEDIKGAFITAVSGGSPADNAGLLMKDVIISVDGKDVETSGDLIKLLLNSSVGDKVKVGYIRDGKETTVEVTLADQKEVYGEWNTDVPEGSGYGNGGENTPTDPFGGGNPFGGETPFGE
jgi:S1-C subfamily serine protease